MPLTDLENAPLIAQTRAAGIWIFSLALLASQYVLTIYGYQCLCLRVFYDIVKSPVLVPSSGLVCETLRGQLQASNENTEYPSMIDIAPSPQFFTDSTTSELYIFQVVSRYLQTSHTATKSRDLSPFRHLAATIVSFQYFSPLTP